MNKLDYITTFNHRQFVPARWHAFNYALNRLQLGMKVTVSDIRQDALHNASENYIRQGLADARAYINR